MEHMFITALKTLHTIAPVMLILEIIILVAFLVVSRKWKKQDPERWNRKY